MGPTPLGPHIHTEEPYTPWGPTPLRPHTHTEVSHTPEFGSSTASLIPNDEACPLFSAVHFLVKWHSPSCATFSTHTARARWPCMTGKKATWRTALGENAGARKSACLDNAFVNWLYHYQGSRGVLFSPLSKHGIERFLVRTVHNHSPSRLAFVEIGLRVFRSPMTSL